MVNLKILAHVPAFELIPGQRLALPHELKSLGIKIVNKLRQCGTPRCFVVSNLKIAFESSTETDTTRFIKGAWLNATPVTAVIQAAQPNSIALLSRKCCYSHHPPAFLHRGYCYYICTGIRGENYCLVRISLKNTLLPEEDWKRMAIHHEAMQRTSVRASRRGRIGPIQVFSPAQPMEKAFNTN